MKTEKKGKWRMCIIDVVLYILPRECYHCLQYLSNKSQFLDYWTQQMNHCNVSGGTQKLTVQGYTCIMKI